jgi:hypothetical protein
MNKTIEQTLVADAGNVSRLAYQLWEDAGRPAGRDLEFWLAAESKLRSASQARATSTAPEAIVVTPSVPAQSKTSKAPRASRGGVKKSWPKPYPSLPKF